MILEVFTLIPDVFKRILDVFKLIPDLFKLILDVFTLILDVQELIFAKIYRIISILIIWIKKEIFGSLIKFVSKRSKFAYKRIYLGPSKNLCQKGANLCQRRSKFMSFHVEIMLVHHSMSGAQILYLYPNFSLIFHVLRLLLINYFNFYLFNKKYFLLIKIQI